MNSTPIYLDNQATTRTDPRVLEAMMPYFTEIYGNPHSDSHVFGWNAQEAVDRSRVHVAQLVNADPREIIFTSGATESVNTVLRGLSNQKTKSRNRIVTVPTEHSCVLETCAALSRSGFRVEFLPIQPDGLVDLGQLKKKINKKTLLVSVMLANNEIGVIQPISEIAEICQRVGAYFHTDATQAVGKIPVDVRKLRVDFMSFSAHKYYGPKGIGATYVKWGRLPCLQPLLTGGNQENGLSPGTIPTPLVVGFGEASRIAQTDLDRDMEHCKHLSNTMFEHLARKIPGLLLFGHTETRLPGNLNVGFPGVSGEEIVDRVGSRIAISTGSACSSQTAEPSHVLTALGLSDDIASSGVRISVGRFNQKHEINYAAECLTEAAGY
ncbi:MAG: cysteine desulfurase family protein [Candidatus Dadabacteria bacterium]|nr:cysteine desulfurase family protein [Candidatus Dadabacteria bacterium]